MSRVKDWNYSPRDLWSWPLLRGMVIIPVGHFLGARSWNKDLGCSPTSHLKWGTNQRGRVGKVYPANNNVNVLSRSKLTLRSLDIVFERPCPRHVYF